MTEFWIMTLLLLLGNPSHSIRAKATVELTKFGPEYVETFVDQGKWSNDLETKFRIKTITNKIVKGFPIWFYANAKMETCRRIREQQILQVFKDQRQDDWGLYQEIRTYTEDKDLEDEDRCGLLKKILLISYVRPNDAHDYLLILKKIGTRSAAMAIIEILEEEFIRDPNEDMPFYLLEALVDFKKEHWYIGEALMDFHDRKFLLKREKYVRTWYWKRTLEWLTMPDIFDRIIEGQK